MDCPLGIPYQTKEEKIEMKTLKEDKDFQIENAKLARFGARKAELEATRQKKVQDNYIAKQSAPDGSDAIARALDVLNGVIGAKATTHEQDIAAIDAELEVVSRGYAAQKQVVDRIVDELTHKANLSVRGAHKKALGKILEACQGVETASKEIDAVAADLHANGYPILGHILPAPHANLAQFDSRNPDSVISALARQIKALS
jgi:hypothetical protein